MILINIPFIDFDVILQIIIPFITAAIGYFTGRRKQKNDFLKELQASVDMLVSKNKKQINEIIALREENADLKQQIDKLKNEIEDLKIKIIPKKIHKHEDKK